MFQIIVAFRIAGLQEISRKVVVEILMAIAKGSVLVALNFFEISGVIEISNGGLIG